MTPDYIAPALGLPIAAVLWVIVYLTARKERSHD